MQKKSLNSNIFHFPEKDKKKIENGKFLRNSGKWKTESEKENP